MAPPQITSEIVAVMQRQLGLITREELLDIGVPPARIDWWLRSKALDALYPGIYRRTAGFVPPAQPLLAAVWTCGEGAVAGSRPSLRLMGLTWLESRGIEVAIPAPRHLRRKPFAVVARQLSAADRRMIGAVQGMSPERSVIDLAPDIGEEGMRFLIDDLRRRDLMSIAALRSRAERLDTLYGARMVLAAIAADDFAQESPGERTLAAFLQGFHPQPRWQVEGLVPGRRLDACWIEALYALEYDGRDHHVLPTDRDHDGLRDLETTVGHVLVHRITGGMLRTRPAQTMAGIRTTYERRLAEVPALIDAGIIPPALAERTRRAE